MPRGLKALLLDCFWNWREKPDYLDVVYSFSLDFSLHPGLQEGLARDMNLQPTQVYNWFANYRRRQKSSLLRTEKLNNSRPERTLTYPKKEQQDEGSYAPQTAGLSLPNGLWMWSRKLKNNLKFPQEGTDIPSPEQHLYADGSSGHWRTPVECLTLSRGCCSVEGANIDKACARTGEKRCPSQKGHQMKANTWEAVGFSSQMSGLGQYSSKTGHFQAPSQNLERTSATGNKVLLHLANEIHFIAFWSNY